MANELLGSATYIAWVLAAGTTTLSSRFRTANDAPTVEMLDATAGADTAKTYITGFKDANFSVTMLVQSGSLPALATALTEGGYGTLIVGYEGSATGKAKITIPAYCLGAASNVQYNQLIEYSINFQQNGNRTYGTF